jgi:glycosyltransferase involved in cell wall biosynthesis
MHCVGPGSAPRGHPWVTAMLEYGLHRTVGPRLLRRATRVTWMGQSVLHLSPYAVFPPDYGGALRTHNICLHLSRHYRVDLFCQQVRRRDLGRSFSPQLRELSPGYFEFCPRNVLSLAAYAGFTRLGCPAFLQSEILSVSAAAWLRGRIDAAKVVNVEHPWQFKWAHSRVGGSKPVVVTAHNIEAEMMAAYPIRAPRPLASWLRKELLRREAYALRNATRIFTMSRENSQLITARYGVDPERCIAIPNGVDCDRFRPADPARRATRRQELGLGGKFVILFTGSSHAPNQAAARTIIEWAKAWPDDGVRFLIAGSIGTAFPHVKAPRVVFTGPVEDITPYFEAADIAVNPLTSGSGTTLKQVEYMAAGLPCVATPIGARGLAVIDGENGYIRGVDATPELLRRLIPRYDERTTVGRNARQFAEQNFDWAVIADKVMRVYEELGAEPSAERVSPCAAFMES